MNKTPAKAQRQTEQRAPALKTPQSIVHIKHKITLRQYKYWVLLLQELRAKYDAKELPDEDGFFSVPLDQISGSMGYVPVKAELRADFSAIRREPICFNVLEKDGQPEYYEAGFISEFKISTNRIRFKFPSFLEKVMKGLDEPRAMFALINWDVFNHFTGKYEAIIYKLCKDYINSPGKRTPDMTLEQFREYMGLKSTEYQQYEDLNKRCIKGAVKAINESDVSDILVTPEIYRSGRKVTGLYFKVEHKKQTSLPFPEMEGESIFRFAKVPIAPKLQQEYLAIRPQEEIILCIERANEYGEGLEQAGKMANYGAIYRKAIAEGWHEQQAAKKAAEEKKKSVKQSKANQAQAEAKKAQEYEENLRQARKEKEEAWAWFLSLSDELKQAIESEFREQARAGELMVYKNNNSAVFRIFLRNKRFG